MKKLNILLFAAALTLVACGQREAAPSAAAVEVAEQYCARNFKPWFELGRACKLEERSGKPGASCATLGQAGGIVSERFIDSARQKCSSPSLPEMQAILN